MAQNDSGAIAPPRFSQSLGFTMLKIFERVWIATSILLFVIGIFAAAYGLMPNDVGIYVMIWMPGMIIISFPLGIVGLFLSSSILEAFELYVLGYESGTHISYVSYVCFEWIAVISCGIVQYKYTLKFFRYLNRTGIQNET
jgi:hypothetical protein